MTKILIRTGETTKDTACFCCGKKIKTAHGLSDGNFYGPTCAANAIGASERVLMISLGFWKLNADGSGGYTELGRETSFAAREAAIQALNATL